MFKKIVAAAAALALLAGCMPETVAPEPARVPKFTIVVYAYVSDSDASPVNFIDIPITLILTATTVADEAPAAIFDVGDGTMSDTADLAIEHTPWKYEFYEATEPIDVSVSAAVILDEGVTLACHALAGSELEGTILTLDDAPGPGPVGVTCDFVIF